MGRIKCSIKISLIDFFRLSFSVRALEDLSLKSWFMCVSDGLCCSKPVSTLVSLLSNFKCFELYRQSVLCFLQIHRKKPSSSLNILNEISAALHPWPVLLLPPLHLGCKVPLTSQPHSQSSHTHFHSCSPIG